MLNIDATWSKPMPLIDDSKNNMIYAVRNITVVPERPGAYLFARRHGSIIAPLYVGETANLRSRLLQHLNDVRIMKGLEAAPSGERLFLFCEPRFKKGQRQNKVLELLQKTLISHAMSEGWELLNIQLTRIKFHTISFKGNRVSERLAPRRMYVQ